MCIVLQDTPTVEVFATAYGAIYQNDAERCWEVDFAGKLARFDYRNFMKLRSAVYRFDIERMLLDSTKTPDLEIIFICACEHSYVLTLTQIIALRELLEGTFVMLDLNNIIHNALYRVSA